MLKWIVWNRSVRSFNCVNKWLMFNWIISVNSNTWKYLTVCKQIFNSCVQEQDSDGSNEQELPYSLRKRSRLCFACLNQTLVLPHMKNATWAWCRHEVQVPGCYMIGLTMLLGWFLIQVPGCWKAASVNKQSSWKPESFELPCIHWKLIKELRKERRKGKPGQHMHLTDWKWKF